MKKKILVLVGIAVCAILLTSPALASGSYSKIYGNANEDDTIDMRDTTYIKLVIFGKKPKTDLADANYDGKISMLDIGQTKLIILDRENELTITDMPGRTVTIPGEVNRVVTLYPPATKIIYTIAPDKLVGIDSVSVGYEGFREIDPRIEDMPVVGTGSAVNKEVVLYLSPDVIITVPRSGSSSPDKLQETLRVPFICVNPQDYDGIKKAYQLLGVVLGEEDRAEELVSYYDENVNYITDKTSLIPEDEKVRVYFAGGGPEGGSVLTTVGKNFIWHYNINLAGGINVAENLTGNFNTVSIEQVIRWDPDVIITGRAESAYEEILSDPKWQDISAVRNGSVYVVPYYTHTWGYPTSEWIMGTMWLADRLYPEIVDLDMTVETKEFYSKFFRCDLSDEEVYEILHPQKEISPT
jgi:iron complex transport system substrate-binding protein